MIELKLTGKTLAELAQAVRELNNQLATTPVEKTLSDFGLQEIAEYLRQHGIETSAIAPAEAPKPLGELIKEEEEKALEKTKAAKPKAKKAKVEEPEKEAEEAEEDPLAPPTDMSGADAKKEAIRKVMAVYTTPEGKKVSKQVLATFGVNNYHLIDESRGNELLKAITEAIAKAGLTA